jgi:hypothetical protein
MPKKPSWDPNKHLLFLPAITEAWDIQISDGVQTALLLRPGLYQCNFDAPTHARPTGNAKWMYQIAKKRLRLRKPTPIDLPDPPDESPYVGLINPDSHYVVGEELTLQFLPARQGYFEVRIRGLNCPQDCSVLVGENHYTRKEGLAAGSYVIRVRWVPNQGTDDPRRWSQWSRPLRLTYHPTDDEDTVWKLRVHEHRLSLMAERDVNGIVTVTDPWAIPPSCPKDEPVRWFHTPCYDGSTMLLNEDPDYYRDPFAYYLDCIDHLKRRGVVFRTWHDLLDGNIGKADTEVIIQFDMDAGPMSMRRICSEFERMEINANVMVHRTCHDWYNYSIDDLDLEYLKEAERRGWSVGYHNNSIGNVQRLNRLGDYGTEVLKAATERFGRDVLHLRRLFTVRTFTHHGGIVFNKLTPPPENLDIVCVDKAFNKPLWKSIRSSFSDGGFMSRPCTLREKIETLKPGLHFFRNHPVKYANYTPPFDIPPLDVSDAVKAGSEPTEQLREWITRELTRQDTWLKLRNEYRMGRRLSYAGTDKPISSGFAPFSELRERAERFRARRREGFLRQYPWLQGDPRVFWWRMLHAYCPKEGELLNVGAMPPDRRDETGDFIAPQMRVLEMDIDPNRKPHILCDVTEAPSELDNRFAGVLLMGLPYIHSPGKAVQACARLTRPGGVGMFGFASDTHPFRGGMWKPRTRPVWRRRCEPLDNIGLKGLLWSFDRDGLEDLFRAWDEVSVEFFSHYWFVFCRKGLE